MDSHPAKERRETVSLYKRGKVYWSAIWVDGVRHMRSLETTNRRRAETIYLAGKLGIGVTNPA
jgi:hypothetical protein